MSLPCYHIHLACVASDTILQTAQDDLALFAEGRAFLTRDLLVNKARSANYSWRCINDCDVVVMMIGQEYGTMTSPLGVSQLHLSYSNARTIKKPMVILIHRKARHSEDRHLSELVRLVESQEASSVTHFDDSKNLISILEATLGKQLSQKDCSRLPMTDTANLPKLSPTINAEPNIANLSQIRAKKHMSHSLRPALLIDNEFDMGCTAHAFQGGTLMTVPFDVRLTWRAVLLALVAMGAPFSSQGLARCLNECIDKQYAHDMIVKMYPQVHIISRHQVVKSDVLWIQDELQLAGHIIPIDPNGASTLWEVSPKTKHTINNPNKKD